MSLPQLENGYTKIANELLEALAQIRIPGEARQVLDVILRKTYGYQKKEDEISLSQFYLATRIAKSSLVRAIKTLEKMNLIYKKVNGVTCVYSIIKDYSQWKPFTKKQTVYKKVKNHLQKSKQTVYEKVTHKRNRKKIYCQNSIEFRLSELLLSLIRQRNPNFKQPDLQKWAVHIDRMIRIDGRPPDDVEKIIRWCQADGFWRANVLSTEKLRKQYDQLWMRITGGNGRAAQERTRYY